MPVTKAISVSHLLGPIAPKDIHTPAEDFVLERGGVLKDDVVVGRRYGSGDGPVIAVLGGISANRLVADCGQASGPGWWSDLVRAGGPVDLNKVTVLGYDFAPRADIDTPPTITTLDQSRRLVRLLDAAGIAKADAIIGSSYGGMTALKFAEEFPDRVGRLCVIGAAHRPYPIGVAWRGIQRRVVRLALDAGQPEQGLKLARELAMTTYRTPEEFSDRFTLDETRADPIAFDICDYLESRGDAFAAHMSAKRFLALSESIDVHRAEPEEITAPTLLISIISDQLAPLAEMRSLRDRLAGPAELHTITSLFGHDAFLKEYDALTPVLQRFVKKVQNDR